MNLKTVTLMLIILILSVNASYAFNSLDVDCEDILYGQATRINVKLPGDARGIVNVTIDDEIHSFDINSSRIYGLNGKLLMPVEIDGLKVGEYNVTVEFDNMTAHSSFNVTKPHKYTFNSTDLIKDYRNGSDFAVQVLADGEAIGANENVTLFVNGVNYTRTTDNDGVAHLNINLEPGNYIISYEYRTYKSYNNIMVL